ncbi:hypothetical protein ABPG77_009609 [Micractinium sp. CCAP 211/92]
MAETGGDGLPFIGSLMSLVSHGEIRYEGTLFTIDMPNSTIALSNVRCFGTEGRRKDNDVPPSDQVFEYVVFKGSEIKELTVVQPPPPAPAPPPQPALGFNDPAIVSAGPPPPPPPGAASPWGPPPPPGQPFGAPPPPGGQPAFGSSPWGPPPPGPHAPPPPPHGGVPGQPAPAPAPTVSVAPVGAANGSAAPAQQQRPASYAHAAGGRAPAPQRGGRGGPRGPAGGQQQHRSGPRGGQQQQQQQIPRAPPVEVPKEEFNFEEALKKFNKEALEKEAEGEHVPVAPVQSSYNKDDFFDQLSCDTLERMAISDEGGRDDWRAKMAAQRKVDIETFGGVGRAGRGYRGRGRGRGYYRGRGGGRGRGGQQDGQLA